MKYKHKYEQPPSVLPNGIQTHSLKNTPNIGHLSFFFLSCHPDKTLEENLVQSALKYIELVLSFLVKIFSSVQRGNCWIFFFSKTEPSAKNILLKHSKIQQRCSC